MAIRNDFAPGEVLAAADLNDTFGSKLNAANPSATSSLTVTGTGPQVTFVDSDLANAFAQINGFDGRIAFLSDTQNTVANSQISFSIDGTERMVLDANGLISGSGTSLGAWTTYTPTLTNMTLGNGTRVGRFCRVGRVVYFMASFTLGSTSAVSSDALLELPVTPQGNAGVVGVARYIDASLSTDHVGAIRQEGFLMQANPAAGQGRVSATAPFTWDTGDSISVSGSYEAA